MNEEEKENAAKEDRKPIIMEHINLHACRHSFATRCLEAGIAPKIVQTWLGHSSIEITLDLYSHVNQDVSFENMRRLEAVSSNAGAV